MGASTATRHIGEPPAWASVDEQKAAEYQERRARARYEQIEPEAPRTKRDGAVVLGPFYPLTWLLP